MVQPYGERRRYLTGTYWGGWQSQNASNAAADEIIASPDKHLLSQAELWEAEGGWNTFTMTMGLALAGAMVAGALNPRTMSYLQSGQLRFREWALLGGASLAGGFAGNQLGISVFGNQQRYTNHWMAYTFVKSQNRDESRDYLQYTPNY